MRSYESTHPWMTFTIDLSRAPAKLWSFLGECCAMCDTISNIPLLPDDRRALERIYMARSAASSFPEGGTTLDESEIAALVGGSLDLPPSRSYLAIEAGNVVGAIGHIREGIGTHIRADLFPGMIEEYNTCVLDRLVLPEHVRPGVYRGTVSEATICGVPSVAAEDCAFLTESLCDWLSSGTFQAPRGMEVAFGILKAILIRLYMCWIQPFGAGNRRTTALAEHHVLFSSGVPMPASLLLPVHYSHTRTEFTRLFTQASRPDGKLLPFIRYAVEGFRDCLRELTDDLTGILEQSLLDHFIHEAFRDRTSPADLRRRDLAVDLCRHGEAVRMQDLVNISPRIALAYSSRSRKTLARDIAGLVSLGIIRRDGDGVVMCDDILSRIR